MGLDDFATPQAAVLAGVTAALMSDRTRDVMRRGAVYGVAGVLKVADVATGAARGVARGVSNNGEPAEDAGESQKSSRPVQRARSRSARSASEATS